MLIQFKDFRLDWKEKILLFHYAQLMKTKQLSAEASDVNIFKVAIYIKNYTHCSGPKLAYCSLEK